MTGNQPKCPHCGTAKQVSACGELYHCKRCGGLFDDDPEEGGDYDDRDPSKRLLRREGKKCRRHQ